MKKPPFDVKGTITGRITNTEPNLSPNFEERDRPLKTLPDSVVTADFSEIERRVIASIPASKLDLGTAIIKRLFEVSEMAADIPRPLTIGRCHMKLAMIRNELMRIEKLVDALPPVD